MTVEVNGKELSELGCHVFFYDENFLCAFHVGTEGFGGERGEETELEVVDFLSFRFQFFYRFFQGAIGGGDAYEEKVGIRVFMGHIEWFDGRGDGFEFPVPFFHFHDAVGLSFSGLAEYVVFQAGGEEHTVLYAGDGSRGNAVFAVFKAVEVGFLLCIQFRQSFGEEFAAVNAYAVHVEGRYGLFAHTELQVGEDDDGGLEFFGQVEGFLGNVVAVFNGGSGQHDFSASPWPEAMA